MPWADRVQRAGLAGAMRVLEQRLGNIFAAASRTALAAYTRRLAASVGPPPQLPAAALAALRGGAPTPRAPYLESRPASLPYPPYSNPDHASSGAAGGVCGAGPVGSLGGLADHGRPQTVTVSLDVVSKDGADCVRITLAEACERREAAAAKPPAEQVSHHRCVAASRLCSAGSSLNKPAPIGAAVHGARSGVHLADARRVQLVEGKIPRPDPTQTRLHSAASWQGGWPLSASARAAGQPAIKSTLMELLADGLAPEDAAAHDSSQQRVPAAPAAPAVHRLSEPEPLPEHVQPLLPRVVSEVPLQSAPHVIRHIAPQPAVPAALSLRAEKLHPPMRGSLLVDTQTAADRAAPAEELLSPPAQKLHSPSAQKLHLPMRGTGPPARARGAAPQSSLGFLFERQHRPAAVRAAPGAAAPAGPVGGEAATGLTLPGRVSQGFQGPLAESQVAAAGKRIAPVLADGLASARPAVQAMPAQAQVPARLATCDARRLLPALASRCRAPAAPAGPCRDTLMRSLVASMSGAGSDLSKAAAPWSGTGMQTGDVTAEPALRETCGPGATGSACHGVPGHVVPAAARTQVQRPGFEAPAGSPNMAKNTGCASAQAPAASAAAADGTAAGTAAMPGEPAAAVAAMAKRASSDVLLSTVLQSNSMPAVAGEALPAMPPGRPGMQAVTAMHGPAVALHPVPVGPLASTPPKGLAGVAAAAGRAPASALAAAAAVSVAAGGLRTAAGAFPWPAYFIGTRDSFTHRLVPLRRQVNPSHITLII